jgi:hypothetical protein
MQMKAPEILRRAADLVGGDRELTHGTKLENHAKIAAMWNAYLAIRRNPAAPLNQTDVALLMVLLKVARTQLGAFNADDFTDMAGYAGCAGEVAEALAGD